MSTRKWPFYDLEVGDDFIAIRPPRSLKGKVYAHGVETGKRFTIERLDKPDPKTDLRIKRVA